MNTPTNKSRNFKDSTINFIDLLYDLNINRLFIFKTMGIAGFISAIIAYNTPDVFTANTIFFPQAQKELKSNSGISGLASIVGLNLNDLNGEIIPISLYPQILESVPFKKELLKQNISSNLDEDATLGEYLLKDSRSSFIDLVKKYTLGIPGLISDFFQPLESNEVVKNDELGIYPLSENDRKLFAIIESNLKIYVNDLEGFITLEYSDKDKYVAAKTAKLAKELLQEYIINFKIQSAREFLKFTTNQYEQNRIVYERLQDSIAVFKDMNLNISSSLYQNKVDRLERELNIVSLVAEQLASQVEQAKLEVNKNTPVFAVIQPVIVPFERSAPMRSLIVLSWTFVAFLISVAYLVLRDQVSEILTSIKKGEA